MEEGFFPAGLKLGFSNIKLNTFRFLPVEGIIDYRA